MLPERLSTDLTSLNPGEARLAVVTEMVVAADGAFSQTCVHRALVNNKAKLAYDAVSAWIDGAGALPDAARAVPGMDVQLRSQDEAAQRLRRHRQAQGSLEFETFQPRALFDGERVVDIRQQVQNRARQLIEELMIATNTCTAQFLARGGGASLRRVVRSPERWQRIADVARKFGESLPKASDSRALEAFLAWRHKADPLRFPDLSLVIVKLMGSGEYVVEQPGGAPIGHFGLAVRDYTHSTAPNRRFPDLITLRMLKGILSGTEAPYSLGELQALAQHCTQQADAAQKVERRMRKSEAALLLESHVGQAYDAIVTGHSMSDTWVRIFNPPAEGRLAGGVPSSKWVNQYASSSCPPTSSAGSSTSCWSTEEAIEARTGAGHAPITGLARGRNSTRDAHAATRRHGAAPFAAKASRNAFASAQAEKPEDQQDDDHCAHQPDQSVHDRTPLNEVLETDTESETTAPNQSLLLAAFSASLASPTFFCTLPSIFVARPLASCFLLPRILPVFCCSLPAASLTAPLT